MKVFQKRGVRAASNVLPIEDFVLFRDLENKFNERKIAAVVKEAESMLETPVPMLPASLYREFTINGNRANYEGLYFRRRRMALILSLAESYEKKGRFAEKLMDVVWAIMEESTWIIPAHLYNSPIYGDATLGPVYDNDALHGIDLFSAATGATLALVYTYSKDTLDSIAPIITKKMKFQMHDRIVKPFLQCTFWWTGERGNRINNWCPWIISNILLLTAVTEDSLYIREKVVDKALVAIDNFINCYAPDGGCDEGPSYWNAAGASLFDCLELLEDISGGKINVYDDALIKNIGEYICKMNINSDNFINFADCGPKCCPDGAMIVRYGTKLKSDILVSFGKTMASIRDLLVDANLVYRTAKSMCYPDLSGDKCVAATKVWFPDLKVMVSRESEDSAKGTLLAMKGGNNDEMHNHNDVGNFIVYKNGNPVIIDTGVGTYTHQTFSPQRYELWFMQSGYHNLPSFGGVDQKNGARFASKNEVYDGEKNSLSAELCDAYPKEAGVLSYVRAAKLDGGKVTVTDTVELDCEKEIVFHLMCHRAPTILSEGSIALAEGMTLTYDKKLRCNIEEFEPTGMNTKQTWGTEKLWRIHLSDTAKAGSYTITVE